MPGIQNAKGLTRYPFRSHAPVNQILSRPGSFGGSGTLAAPVSFSSSRPGPAGVAASPAARRGGRIRPAGIVVAVVDVKAVLVKAAAAHQDPPPAMARPPSAR